MKVVKAFALVKFQCSDTWLYAVFASLTETSTLTGQSFCNSK